MFLMYVEHKQPFHHGKSLFTFLGSPDSLIVQKLAPYCSFLCLKLGLFIFTNWSQFTISNLKLFANTLGISEIRCFLCIDTFDTHTFILYFHMEL